MQAFLASSTGGDNEKTGEPSLDTVDETKYTRATNLQSLVAMSKPKPWYKDWRKISLLVVCVGLVFVMFSILMAPVPSQQSSPAPSPAVPGTVQSPVAPQPGPITRLRQAVTSLVTDAPVAPVPVPVPVPTPAPAAPAVAPQAPILASRASPMDDSKFSDTNLASALYSSN